VTIGRPARTRVLQGGAVPTLAAPTVKFAGVSTLLFDDGQDAILVDGFFSRPGLRAVKLGEIQPDAGIEAKVDGFCREACGRVRAVVPVHAHYDHAMDAPRVAAHLRAALVGDASVMALDASPGKRGAVRAFETVPIGGHWKVTFIPSRHGWVPFGWPAGEIVSRIDPPAPADDWKAGNVWSLLIEHDGGASYLVHASAGFVEKDNPLVGRRADVVFLGAAFLGWRGEDYRERYWQGTVGAVGATSVVLVHWDDITQWPAEPVPFPIERFGTTWRHFEKLAAARGIALNLPAPDAEPFDPRRASRP
jgi:L-ascorbate metabolism protein UlaG (beta-lactamase superfamily)